MLKKRDSSLDALRVLAAAFITFFHILQSAVSNDPTLSAQTSSLVSAISTPLNLTSCFFLITGYLWLSDKKICTYSKTLHNIIRFVLVLFSIGLCYAFMERFFTTRSFSLNLILASLTDVLTGNLWDHMWFLYSIIGVYLLLPVLKPFFEQRPVKDLSVFVAILFVFSILSPIISQTTSYAIPVNLHLSESIFFVCAGGLISKLSPLQRRAGYAFAALYCLSIIASFAIEIFAAHLSAWTNLTSCTSAFSIFLIATIFLRDMPEIPWVRSISNCSFGIYLFHPFFINVIVKVLNIYPLRQYPFLSVIGMFILAFGLSYAATYLLRRIAWIKKHIL